MKGGRPEGSKDSPGAPRQLRKAAFRRKVLRHAELSADATLEQIRRLGFFDVRRLFDEHGRLRPITDLSEAEAACIAGIEVVTRKGKEGEEGDTIVKVKLADRGRYLELAAKSHGLLIDKHQHTVTASLEELVAGRLPKNTEDTEENAPL